MTTQKKDQKIAKSGKMEAMNLYSLWPTLIRTYRFRAMNGTKNGKRLILALPGSLP